MAGATGAEEDARWKLEAERSEDAGAACATGAVPVRVTVATMPRATTPAVIAGRRAERRAASRRLRRLRGGVESELI